MRLPNRWGAGCLFAYSGVEGKTDWFNPFAGRLSGDRLGVVFVLHDSRHELFFESSANLGDLSFEVVCSDLVDARAGSGEHARVRFLFLDKDTIIGEVPEGFVPRSVGCQTALATQSAGDNIRFAYSYDAEGGDFALSKAQAGLQADLDAEYSRKIAFFDRLPRPSGLTEDAERTYYKAWSVLKVNAESAQGSLKYLWFTPDRLPHRNVFLWDTVFQSLAWTLAFPNLASEALMAVLDRQRSNGFIPHTLAPDPRFDSEITQPPILAWGCLEVYRSGAGIDFLRWAYPRLKAYLEWDMANRNLNGRGLFGWQIDEIEMCPCGESGMDNSPRFDIAGADDAIDLSAFLVSDMRAMEQIALELEITEDTQLWMEKADHLGRLIRESMWDKESGFFYDVNNRREFIKIKTPASFLPMFAGAADEEQAKHLIRHLADPAEFWLTLPVPSVAADEPSFCNDMWRGPTWLNYNYLVVKALERYACKELAGELIRRTISEVSRWYMQLGSIFEFYDPNGQTPPTLLVRKGGVGTDGATGFGTIMDYGWSAAAYVLFALEAGSVLTEASGVRAEP